MSNGKNIPKKLSKQESTTVSWTMPRYSGTYLPSTVNSLEDWLTLLRQDSLAPPSARPANGVELMIPETSGLTRSELSVRFDPSTSSWRTYQESLLPPSPKEPQAMGQLWSGNLPKSGMIVSGKLSELTMSVLPIAEKDGSALGSWATPRAREGNAGEAGSVGSKHNAQKRYLDGMVQETWSTPVADDTGNRKKKYAQGGTPLSMQTGMWPTTRVADTEGGLVHNVEFTNGSFSRKNKDGVRWGVKLRDAAENWATVTTQEIHHPDFSTNLTESGRRKPKKGKTSHSLGLADQSVQHTMNWPTAASRDYKGGSGTIVEKNGKLVRQSNTTGTQYGARLDAVAETWTKNWPTVTANEDAAGLPTGNMQKMLGNHPNLRDVTGDTHSGHPDPTIQTDGDLSSQTDQTSHPPLPKTLSPLFAEWLMGLPIGLTDLKPLETASFHLWLQHFYEG